MQVLTKLLVGGTYRKVYRTVMLLGGDPLGRLSLLRKVMEVKVRRAQNLANVQKRK